MPWPAPDVCVAQPVRPCFTHLPTDHIHFVSVHDGMGDKPIGNKMLKPEVMTIWRSTDSQRNGARPSRASAHSAGFPQARCRTHLDRIRSSALPACAAAGMPRFQIGHTVGHFLHVAHSITLAFATLNLVSVSRSRRRAGHRPRLSMSAWRTLCAPKDPREGG
jgi:hypothetical protein